MRGRVLNYRTARARGERAPFRGRGLSPYPHNPPKPGGRALNYRAGPQAERENRPGGYSLPFMKTNTQQQNEQDLRSLLQNVSARRVLWRILCAARNAENAFCVRDPYSTAYICGQQSIGVWLMEEIWRADPGAFMRMRLESEAAQRARRQTQEEENDNP